MTKLIDPKWDQFWSKRADPLNASDSEEHYRAYGAELALLWDRANMGRVLEFGYGDGSLVEPLGFDKVDRYLGVDISPKMHDAFALSYPNLEARVGGHDFESGEKFDLIFSTAVVQYMSPPVAREHMQSCVAQLAPGGRIVWAAVPWVRLRWAYARGDLAGTTRRSLPLALAAHGKRRLLSDNMGYWHDTPFFSELAAEVGLTYSSYGSMNYSYRFHSVFVDDSNDVIELGS